MKKSVIALAVAAALPVAAQADTILSGSVAVEYKLGAIHEPSIETKLSAKSSEKLANGMDVTTSFNVLGDKTQGTASLSSDDFGVIKGGSAAKTLVDVADGDDGVNEHDADLNGIAYTGNFAGIDVNASTGKFDENDSAITALVKYNTYGASYEFNGLTVTGQSTKEGIKSATRKYTASYAFGDLTVSGSKSDGADAVVKAAYVVTRGDLKVTASADSADDWDLEAVYTMGDLALTAKDDEQAGGAKVSAKYVAGELSLEVDSDSKVVVAYDMGNADLSMTRDDDDTKVKYTVAF
jgi:hypothetical protein